MIIKEFDETQFDEYVSSYTTEVPDFIDDSIAVEEFINYIKNYVEREFSSIYITDTQYDEATGKLTFVFENDNNMPITNLESIYDSFDAAIEYASEDFLM